MDFFVNENKSDSFFKGLCVQQNDTSLYSVVIAPGFFKPGEQKYPEWKPEFIYVNINPKTAVELIQNKESLPRFDYIIAKPDYAKQFGNFRGLKFYSKIGEYRKDGKLETLDPEFPNHLNRDELLLGFAYNPPQGTYTKSKIISLSVNETDDTFAYETQPSDFRKSKVVSLQEWKKNHFYIKEQIVNSNLKLWYCKSTHISDVFDEDLKYYWEPISGSIDENDVIEIINNYVRPAAPQWSVQFNLDNIHFGGSENLKWYNSLKELFLNGVIVLNKQELDDGTEIMTPNEGEIKLFFEKKESTLLLKVKMENGREYVISSFLV